MAKSSLQGHEAAMSQFISIPWCADIVRKPGTVVFVPTSRFPADSQGKSPTQNQLFRDTLNNTDTVPHIIGLYQNPLSFEIGPNATPIFSSASNAGNAQTLMIKSCSLMFDIRSGINGYNGTAHGGFITSVIDEAMGSLLFVNYSLQREVEARGGGCRRVSSIWTVFNSLRRVWRCNFRSPL
ncbi:hypothetical protein OCU04_000211 [Sclerotinia nivalis]|uniref:Thioesterase domain-containing protein n=1 Tax=Sclerotinia nivalis TaxID=352851 RepID=A0A9X0DPI5_9HELO|nr:hypothetical protein OCU04_000211 [Sclerotinia nivalis]